MMGHVFTNSVFKRLKLGFYIHLLYDTSSKDVFAEQ